MRQNLTGSRFSRLTVLGDCGRTTKNETIWRCLCDCGTQRDVRGSHLKSKNVQSCGCLARELTSIRMKFGAPLATTHGGRHKPEYMVWRNMRVRCSSPNDAAYPRYGGRGISVAAEWDDFAVFFRDMGPRPSPTHTLDRIDNDGPYCAANCRWATKRQQAENRRTTINTVVDGEMMCLKALARKNGLPYRQVHMRVTRLEWSIERTISTPIRTLIRGSK